MNHAITTVSAKLIAKLKEAGEEVAKLLSFFLHCILITPNQSPIAIEVDFFLKQRALSLVISRSHDTYYNVSKNKPLLHVLLCPEFTSVEAIDDKNLFGLLIGRYRRESPKRFKESTTFASNSLRPPAKGCES